MLHTVHNKIIIIMIMIIIIIVPVASIKEGPMLGLLRLLFKGLSVEGLGLLYPKS